MSSPTVAQASTDAARLLASTWHTTPAGDPVTPVDPFQIAFDLEIQVYRSNLAGSDSGKIVKTLHENPIIFLNKKDPANRARFTLAHELGHYVKRAGDASYEYTDKRDQLSGSGTNDEERYANAFAAELLMPAAVVKRRWKDLPSVAVLAKDFQVSAEAMGLRLQILNLR
jgi:Zn-dependent peptidase ImmA (M78 family)